MATITSANSTFILVVSTLFPIPTELQGYGVDDAFSTEAGESAETKLGVDGLFAAGWVPRLYKMTVKFIAASPSCAIFDAIDQAETQAQEKYGLSGIITIPSLGTVATLSNGYLTRISALPDAKKTYADRSFELTWGNISRASI